MRTLVAASALLVAVAACGSGEAGPVAPDPGPTQTVCLPEFCVDYPADWNIELGDGFVTFSHPLGPSASVGAIDMEGVVVGAGGTWPADPEATMRAFWDLLDDLGDASLESLDAGSGGAVDSEGELDGERLWHRLLPVLPPQAWGAEMRAPNRGWRTHAEVIVGSLREPLGT
jgi:hypothetical protein